MSSQWVNKFEIMRDLSMAQGCVPVDVANTVTADEKPPSQKILEETEEEFYRNLGVGSGDFSAPDVDLIKHMLNVVREQDDTPDLEAIQQAYEISKISVLSPLSPEFKPLGSGGAGDRVKSNSDQKSKTKTNHKKHKNIAIESLLQNKKNNTENSPIYHTTDNIEKLKLLKPTDFTSENTILSINKETDKFENKEKKQNNPSLNMNCDTSSMFKKKKRPSASGSAKYSINPILNNEPPSYQEYVPSSNAAAYYKKFQECVNIKQMLNEDVWARAERQMREIDEKRKREADLFAESVALSKAVNSPSTQSTSTDPDDQKLDIVRLPSHRHDLHNFCVVCSVISKCTDCNGTKNWREKNILDDKEKIENLKTAAE